MRAPKKSDPLLVVYRIHRKKQQQNSYSGGNKKVCARSCKSCIENSNILKPK